MNCVNLENLSFPEKVSPVRKVDWARLVDAAGLTHVVEPDKKFFSVGTFSSSLFTDSVGTLCTPPQNPSPFLPGCIPCAAQCQRSLSWGLSSFPHTRAGADLDGVDASSLVGESKS